jgi:hypothetical protein
LIFGLVWFGLVLLCDDQTSSFCDAPLFVGSSFSLSLSWLILLFGCLPGCFFCVVLIGFAFGLDWIGLICFFYQTTSLRLLLLALSDGSPLLAAIYLLLLVMILVDLV